MHLNSKCRACLSVSGNMKVLHEKELEGQRLISMFISIVNVEWINHNNIVSFLCNKCEEALEIAYNFQKTCRESNKIITKFLNDKSKDAKDSVTKADTSSYNRNGDESNTDSIDKKSTCIQSGQVEHLKKKADTLLFIESEKESNPHECTFCEKRFLTLSSLKMHYKHHTKKDPGYKLPSKEEQIVVKNEIIQQVKIVDSISSSDGANCSSLFDISNLSSPFNTKQNNSDFNVQKNDSLAYTCSTCDQHFRYESNLQNHLKLHDGNNKCSFCGKLHKSKALMKEHERTHTGKKPYMCSVCGKGFTQSGSLNTHIKQHTGRPEMCNICQKRFCRPSELKLHLRRHSGEKPFLCTKCGKTFIQKSHLSEHTKTHSDERPHQCNYCDKAFKQKSLLKSHEQIHTGKKHFKCRICSYSCFRPYRLQQHMKMHNGELSSEKLHVCPVCHKGFTNKTLADAHKRGSHDAIL